MKTTRWGLVLAACMVSTGTRAQVPLGGSLAHELSYCDARFFHSLADHLYELSKVGKLQLHGDIAYFRVANRRLPKRSRVKFDVPIQVGNIVLDGYFDDIVDVNIKTGLFSWGFLSPTSVATAQAALQPYLWDPDRFKFDAPVYVRTELWDVAQQDKGWQKISTESGEPKPGTYERAFLIEPAGDVPKHVRIGCSIQGGVTSDVITQLRPDFLE